MMDRLHQAFRRSQNQLVSVLENRKAEVKARRLRKTFVFFFFSAWANQIRKLRRGCQIEYSPCLLCPDRTPS